jgi:ABC-type lipoprotein release transport system permease subunit
VTWNARRTLDRLDPVAIIERGQLSTERGQHPRAQNERLLTSANKPLSSWTFYLRHRRRGLALTLTIGVMILGVAFPAFVFGPMIDAWITLFGHLQQVSIVSPLSQRTVDPAVTAQIREHAAVDGVMRAMRLTVRVDVPPMAHPLVPLYGVLEDDLPKLIGLYGAIEPGGRLPQPRTNQIVISKALARNRGWRTGDRIGRAHNSRQDDDLPTEMVIVGILDPRPDQEDPWTGFASLEYLSNHEFYAYHPISLLVLPEAGHKQEIDSWLEETIAGKQIDVQTLTGMQTDFRLAGWIILAVLGIVESVIAVVAAVALAILSYTFFTQRRDEFGILHAVGHSRRWLILRAAGESTSVVVVAWLLGALLCGIGLVCMQVTVFAPKGMAINVFSPAPWAFTLPMPLAVVAMSTGLLARMLSKLDPVTIIERKAQ